MTIEEVLKEMRESRARAEDRYCDPDGGSAATGADVLRWASAIEAAMREPVAEVRACEWGWCMKLLAPNAVDHGTKLYALPPNPTP
jgi:hypothetical protein